MLFWHRILYIFIIFAIFMQYFVTEMYAVFCTEGEGAKVATMILVSTKVPIATHCTCLLGHCWARAVLVLLFSTFYDIDKGGIKKYQKWYTIDALGAMFAIFNPSHF